MADIFEGYAPSKKEPNSTDIFAGYAAPSKKIEQTKNMSWYNDLANTATNVINTTKGIASGISNIVPSTNAILGQPTKEDEEKLAANKQAAYDGLLSFGATISNLFTKTNNKAWNLARNVTNPLGMLIPDSVREQTGKTISNYVQGQNDQFQQNLGKYGQGLQLPYMAGQFLGASAANPIFKGIFSGANAVGDVLAEKFGSGLLGTAASQTGRYAANAAAGAAAGGVFGAMSYDPQNPDILNMQAAKELATNPYSAALGVLGSSAGSYAGQVSKFAQAKEAAFGGKIFNRDVGKPLTKSIMDGLYAHMPIVGDATPRYLQRQSMIPGVTNFVKSLSEDVATRINKINPKTGAPFSGRDNYDLATQAALKSAKMRITNAENELWAPINAIAKQIKLKGEDTQNIKNQAGILYNVHANELQTASPGLKKYLYNIADSKIAHPTFDEIKEIKTTIQSYINSSLNKEGRSVIAAPTLQDLKDFTKKLYNGLDQAIYEANPSLVEQYHKANTFTAAKFQLFDEAGVAFRNAYRKTDLEKAIGDNAKAYNFAQKLLTEKSPTQVGKMLAPFEHGELQKIRAGIISKHMKDSIDNTGDFNVTNFLNKTSEEKNIDQIMGNTYQTLKGLQTVMQPIKVAEQVAQGSGRYKPQQNAMHAGLLGAVGAAAYSGGWGGALGVIASIGALGKLSQWSLLKNGLYYAQKASGNPHLLEMVAKQVQTNMVKAGLIIQQGADGTVRIKDRGDE